MELVCVLTVEAVMGNRACDIVTKANARTSAERGESVLSESGGALGQGQFPSSDIV